MEMKAQIAMTKEHRARKIAVIADTTIMKGRSCDLHPAAKRTASLRPDLFELLARHFDKHTQQMPYGIVQLVDHISCFLCGQFYYCVIE